MKKIITMAAIAISIVACKKDEKPTIVGTNENGEELMVNEKGDTVVYVAPEKPETKEEEVEKPKEGIDKNENDEFVFQFNLKKGETYPFKISSKATNSQSDGQQSATVTSENTTELAYKVVEIKDSTYILDVTYKGLSEKMSDGKETLAFSTYEAEPLNEAAKQRWKFTKAVVGSVFGMEITKTGKVVNVMNLYKVRENVKNKLKGDIPSEELEALDDYLAQSLSDEVMKEMFEESVSYYPQNPVKIGETWNRSEKEGNAKSEVKYTLKSVENGVATIEVKGTSTASDSQSQEGLKMFRSLEGNMTGNFTLNANSGWVKGATMNRTEIIRVTQEYQGQKANYSSTTKTNTSIN